MKNRVIKKFEAKKFEEFKKPILLIKVGNDAHHTLRFSRKAKNGKKEFSWVPWDIPMGIKENYVKEVLGKFFYLYFRDSRGYLNYFEYVGGADENCSHIHIGNVIAIYRGYTARYGHWEDI